MYYTFSLDSQTVHCKKYLVKLNYHFCFVVCGERNIYERGKPLSKHGSLAHHDEFPWHVGIYKKNTTDQWQLTCGGSLISPHTVLTGTSIRYYYYSHILITPYIR